jgi:hypothetical protein
MRRPIRLLAFVLACVSTAIAARAQSSTAPPKPTNYREVLKVTAVGEAAVRLLLPPDQETGVRRIDRN